MCSSYCRQREGDIICVGPVILEKQGDQRPGRMLSGRLFVIRGLGNPEGGSIGIHGV